MARVTRRAAAALADSTNAEAPPAAPPAKARGAKRAAPEPVDNGTAAMVAELRAGSAPPALASRVPRAHEHTARAHAAHACPGAARAPLHGIPNA